MAVRIHLPDYSFHNTQLVNDTCNTGPSFCLPVYDKNDIAFNFLVECSSLEAASLSAGDWKIIAVVSNTCIDELPADNYPYTWQYEATLYPVIEADNLPANYLFVAHMSPTSGTQIADLTTGSCFSLTLMLRKSDSTPPNRLTILGCVGCYSKIDDVCYTSRIKYLNKENAYGFTYKTANYDAYANNLYNTVRLPFYLYNYQMPKEEKNYQKSDGSSIKLYSRIDREYDVKVDYMPKQMHERLNIAFEHDKVLITNTNESGISDTPFVCKEKYELVWPDVPEYNMAMGKTTIKTAQAASLLNSNCN